MATEEGVRLHIAAIDGVLLTEAATEPSGVHYNLGTDDDAHEGDMRPQLGPSDLYPLKDDLVSTRGLEQVFRLVDEATESIAEIRRLLRANDVLGADDRSHHLLVTLKELFAYRELGDSFGCRVIAVYNCLSNCMSQPLVEAQLNSMYKVIVSLRDKPNEPVVVCIDYIDELEAAGLNPDPDPAFASAVDSVVDVLSSR